MGFRIYRTSDGSGMVRYEKISTSPISGVGGKSLRTTTKIVAASNSLDKSSADYVCDGVHDEEEINKAISDLATTGGTVILLEGMYNVGSAGTKILEYSGEQMEVAYGIYITSNVSLVGQGKSTILILDSNNFNIGSAQVGAVILSDSASGIEISHLTVDGNQQSVGFPVVGIYQFNVSDSRISHCSIRNAFYGVGVYLSNNCIIADNVCNSCIIVVGDNNNISRNICNGGIFGVAVSGSKNHICNNTCCNAIEYGIYVSGAMVTPAITTDSNHVYGNICYGCATGIAIEKSDYNSVIGNICYMNNGYGIGIIGSSNIVSDNQVLGNSQSSDNWYDGIYIMSWGGVQPSYNTISNNTVRHMGLVNQHRYGVHIGSNCIGNLVINNDLYQAGTSADFYDEGTDTVYHNNRTTQGWIP